MLIHNLGYPRIGAKRELKFALEAYWKNDIPAEELELVAKQIRLQNWELQKKLNIDLIPSNDFSFYDHVLDMSVMLNAIPKRFTDLGIVDKNLVFSRV